MVRLKKAAGRELSDRLAAYGSGLLAFLLPAGEKLPYELYVQLGLNLDRQLARRAWEVKTGIELAFSREGLPAEFVEAVTDTDAEAKKLLYRINADRRIAETLARESDS